MMLWRINLEMLTVLERVRRDKCNIWNRNPVCSDYIDSLQSIGEAKDSSAETEAGSRYATTTQPMYTRSSTDNTVSIHFSSFQSLIFQGHTCSECLASVRVHSNNNVKRATYHLDYLYRCNIDGMFNLTSRSLQCL